MKTALLAALVGISEHLNFAASNVPDGPALDAINRARAIAEQAQHAGTALADAADSAQASADLRAATIHEQAGEIDRLSSALADSNKFAAQYAEQLDIAKGEVNRLSGLVQAPEVAVAAAPIL